MHHFYLELTIFLGFHLIDCNNLMGAMRLLEKDDVEY